MGKMILALMSAAALFGAATSASAQAKPVAAEDVVGRWTDNNDCSNFVDFNADGSFVTNSGARGRWTLEGDRLTFVGNSTVSARIRMDGRDRIHLTHGDGSAGQSTRCPIPAGGGARALPPLPASIQAALAMSRPVGRAELFGRWTDSGDCGNSIEFVSDGRFLIAGGGSGRWRLEGEQLSFIGERTVTARVRAVGGDRILLIHPDGSLGQSLRC